MIIEDREREYKKGMIRAAFNAWQINQTKKSFPEYQKMMGLGEKQSKLTKEEKEIIKKRSEAAAARAEKAFKENKLVRKYEKII